MTNTEFITFIDECIKQEMLLGPCGYKHRLIGLRNIKSDFNYILSNNPKLDTIDILKRMFKERIENEKIYHDAEETDLWLQEHTESNILSRWIPKDPDENEVLAFLSTLENIPKQKSSFKKYQDACIKHFGQKIDSQLILDYINSKNS